MRPRNQFGLLLGASWIALSLLLYGLGLDRDDTVQRITSFLNVAMVAVFVFMGIREERHREGNGFISFGKGFSAGMMITVIGSVITTIYSYLYFSMLNPGIITYIRMKQEEEMAKRGMSDEMIAKMSNTMESWTSPVMMTLFAFLGMVLIGLVVSLICAAILKKENPTAEIS